MSEIFKEAFNGARFTTEPKNETDILLQHSALAGLLDSNERMDPARCHPNTRDAVIEDIMAWIEGANQAASMMIMYGPAGSGKSALAQSIAERCKLQKLLAAAFFFSKIAQGRNNGRTLIPTIAYQLLSSYPEVRLPIRIRLWREPTLLKKSIQSVMEALLIAPFLSWTFIVLCWITSAFGWFHPRLIVIDGLDECSDNEIQSHILRAAATATERIRQPFRILITCRPEMHLMQTLHKLTINYVELDLGARDASQDIRLYLGDKFEEIKSNHPLARHGSFPASWPGPDVIDKITENASGLFIYASVIMMDVESIKHSPVDRLNIILASFLNPGSPFAKLDSLYLHIFSSVEEDIPMRQILGFLAIPRTAGDGLGLYTTPAMITELLSTLSINTIFLILEELHSVITLAGPDQLIKFRHASISDFLLDKTRSNNFFVDIPMSHETLARGYLRLLQSQLPNCFLRSPYFSAFLEHYKRVLLSERLPKGLVDCDFFLAYRTAVGEPITLPKLRNAWKLESQRMRELFLALLRHTEGHSIIDVYVDGLYRNFPLEPSIRGSLESFPNSRKLQKHEAAIQRALYVPVLHCLLNGGHAATATSLAEKSVIGIYRAHSELEPMPTETSYETVNLWTHGNRSDTPYPRTPLCEFVLACNNCLLILLPHASHYSTNLVNLLLDQQREPPPLSVIHVNRAKVGPYLEQFEGHADAPPELRTFLQEHRASKPSSHEAGDKPTTNIAQSPKNDIYGLVRISSGIDLQGGGRVSSRKGRL